MSNISIVVSANVALKQSAAETSFLKQNTACCIRLQQGWTQQATTVSRNFSDHCKDYHTSHVRVVVRFFPTRHCCAQPSERGEGLRHPVLFQASKGCLSSRDQFLRLEFWLSSRFRFLFPPHQLISSVKFWPTATWTRYLIEIFGKQSYTLHKTNESPSSHGSEDKWWPHSFSSSLRLVHIKIQKL